MDFLVVEAGDSVAAAIASGGMSGCSARGGSTPTPPPDASSPGPGGRSPTRTAAYRHGAHRRLPRPARRPPAQSPPGCAWARGGRCHPRRADRVRTAGREAAPFLVRVSRDWIVEDIAARAVIDASGTWTTANVLGRQRAHGPGENEHATGSCPPCRCPGQGPRTASPAAHTIVVGAGQSATDTLLDLAKLAESRPADSRSPGHLRAASPARAVRRRRGRRTARPRRHRHPAPGPRRRRCDPGGHRIPHPHGQTPADGTVELVSVGADEDSDVGRRCRGQRDRVPARSQHRCRAAPGPRSDPRATRALAPLIDPNEHSCGTVPPHGVDELAHPEPGYYADRRQELRPGADVPARHRLRTGPIRRRRARRRLGGRPRRPARPARNRRLLQQPARRAARTPAAAPRQPRPLPRQSAVGWPPASPAG